MTPKTMELMREHLKKTGGQVCRQIPLQSRHINYFPGRHTISS